MPTVLFWDPALWPVRLSAEPYLDTLRKAGILHDSPKTAADKVAEVLGNPEAWWREPQVQAARTVFCRRFAYGPPDWAQQWARALLSESPPKPAN